MAKCEVLFGRKRLNRKHKKLFDLPNQKVAGNKNWCGRNPKFALQKAKICVAETKNLRGRNQKFAWQKPKICVAETKNLRGRNPKFAWQKPKICVAETQNLRGRNQKFAWQKPTICVAETNNLRGRNQKFAWQKPKISVAEGVAERAATPCHVRRGCVAALCATPLPRNPYARGRAWQLSLPRVAALSATRGTSLCHA